ncbi:YceD family protein [Marinicella sediminis]|uniref:Large ribosomal RNA subunit accumulation protein YceD n=1 Tax=Marinicella sediminis TaxID=1792834 RepID=A0ABV7J9D5_9GAMM|nr:YceD family protein [Marinicella sediminis]
MVKSLPDSIELNAAVRKEWQLTGAVLLSDLDRMPTEMIRSADAVIEYEIYFRQSTAVLGEAVVRIKADLELICQRSLETFKFPLRSDNTIGFISELEDEEKLATDVSPSWVEDMLVDPKALIEDEILLMIPDVPVKPGAELDSQYLNDQDDDTAEEEVENPFAVLKDLK